MGIINMISNIFHLKFNYITAQTDKFRVLSKGKRSIFVIIAQGLLLTHACMVNFYYRFWTSIDFRCVFFFFKVKNIWKFNFKEQVCYENSNVILIKSVLFKLGPIRRKVSISVLMCFGQFMKQLNDLQSPYKLHTTLKSMKVRISRYL